MSGYSARNLILIAVLTVSASTSAWGGEFSFKSNLSLQEEYTDNVYENEHKRTDYITRVLPGFNLSYLAPVISLNVGYNLDYRYYAKNSRNDEITHNGTAKADLTLIENLLYLTASDTYKRVSLDPTIDTTLDSHNYNQSDQNVALVSPYIKLRPTARTDVKLGYRYTNTWYKSETGRDKHEHGGYISLSYELTPQFSFYGGHDYSRVSENGSWYDRQSPYGGVRYEYADKSYIFGQGGYEWLHYHSLDRNTGYPTWSAGLSHLFTTTEVTLTTGIKQTEDPLGTALKESFYTALITQKFNRADVSLELGYSDFEDTKQSNQDKSVYRCSTRVTYEILQDFKITGKYYIEKNESDGYTRRMIAEGGLRYILNNMADIGATYSYIDYNSKLPATENKVINRVTVELHVSY